MGRVLVLAHMKPWVQSPTGHKPGRTELAYKSALRTRKHKHQKFSHPQPLREFEASLELLSSFKDQVPRETCKYLGETVSKFNMPSKAMKLSREKRGGKEK